MKPSPFEYAAPERLEEALALLASEPEARPLAGGQSLIPLLNFRLAAPSLLVDLGRLEGLAGVHVDDDGTLTIGAMTRQRALEHDPRIAERAPLLAETVGWIAHPQIRARGTIGGSLAHADPAAELPVVLLVLGARVRTARAPRSGEEAGPIERDIHLSELFVGPFTTVLEPEEIITSIRIPPPEPREAGAFAEVARRRGDYAIVGAAARVSLSPEGTVERAALSLLNADPSPVLADGVSAALEGRRPTAAGIDAVARAAAEACAPVTDMHGTEGYRRHLVAVLAARVLSRAARRALPAE